MSGWLLNGFAGPLGDKPVRSAVVHGLADLTLTNAWFPQMFMGGHGRDGQAYGPCIGNWICNAAVSFWCT